VLGRAMAEGLAGAGANVAVVDLDAGKAETARAAWTRPASDGGGLRRCVEEGRFGTGGPGNRDALGGVHVLVNAPGINSATPFFDLAEAEWDRILDVNLKSMVFACQVFGKRMIAAGSGGSVINISSASSDRRSPRCSPTACPRRE